MGWLWISASLAVFAVDPQISVELDRDQAYLGDAVTLLLEARIETGWTLTPEELGEKLGDAAVLSKDWRELKPTVQEDPTRYEYRIRLAWYRIGEFTIPPLTLVATPSAGESEMVRSPELGIKIVAMLEEGDQTPASSKPQVTMDVPGLWPYLAAGGLLLLLLGWLLYRRLARRGQPGGKKVVPLLPPHREAIERLNKLTAGSLLKEGKFKRFYVEISTIIRHYYKRLYQIHAEEMTSFELEEWSVSQSGLPDAFVDLNRAFLEQCDRVKYAKYDPVEAENKEVINKAYQIVELLKPKPGEDQHVAAG